MTGRETNSNTTLFLMELIVVIVFFTLVSVICVRLFVAASAYSTESVDVNHAVREAESLSEAWTVCNADLTELSKLYPDAALSLDGESCESGTLTIYYGGDWQPVTEAAYSELPEGFSVLLSARRVPAVDCYGDRADPAAYAAAAEITAVSTPENEPVCALHVDHYLGRDDR